MLITARACSGPTDERGVIGHAWSPDLDTWHVRPPPSAPGAGFGHLEMLQVEVVDGRTVLLFSCPGAQMSAAARCDRGATGAIRLLEAPSPTGPFDPQAATQLCDESRYSGRLVRRRDGTWAWLAFENVDAAGAFVGVLGDPQAFV